MERTYADLFDIDLDALADMLGKARAAALDVPATSVINSGSRIETYWVRKAVLREPVK
jgi:hypothetical protein